MKTMLRWASALCMLSMSTIASAGSLPPGGFRVGYNEGWIENNYGNWLADNPFFGSSAFNVGCTSGNNGCLLNTMFSGMMQGNAKIVRIWLFPALQGICISQSFPKCPVAPGLISDSNPNPNPELIDSLNTVFQLARQNGLKLYITALNAGDAAFAANPNNCPVPGFPNYCPDVSNFYKSLFSNSGATVLNSLLGGRNGVLDLMSLNKEVIYGFDLINEIESAINAGYFSWTGAQAWIRNMTAIVKNSPCDPNASCKTIGDSNGLSVTSSAGGGYAVQELTFGFFSGLRPQSLRCPYLLEHG
jgi:hypothetical protein